MWIAAAVLSAFFAGITSILSKCGVRTTDSDVATALRTGVVLVFSWLMVLVVGSFDQLGSIDARSLLFLVLSGLATGASWICMFKALSLGDVNKVVPVDKSSTALAVILAIVLFGETSHLAVKLIGVVLIMVGALLMVEMKSPGQAKTTGGTWLVYAVASAVFAALTTILAKVGITGVESNLATAVRSVVVLAMAWGIVVAKGKHRHLATLDKREVLFVCLSGVATGASWLCYFWAVQNGVVSVVVPLDKMSIVVSVVISYFVFGERLSWRSGAGLALMVAGTLAMALFA